MSNINEVKSEDKVVTIKSLKRNWISKYPSKDEWIAFHSISGTVKDTGMEVMAAIPATDCGVGQEISVSSAAMFEKPSSLNFDLAALVPFLAVTLIPALEHRGIEPSSFFGKTAVIVGGKNAISCFAIQLLKGWGARVIVVTTENRKKLQDLGADDVINYNKENFGEVCKSVDFILDSLGDDSGTLGASLQRDFGITYVSIACPELKLTIDKGLLSAGSQILKYNKLIKKSDIISAGVDFVTPEVKHHEAIQKLSESLKECVPFPGSIFPGSDPLEAFSWPKDSESGYRYGFPSKESRFDFTGDAYLEAKIKKMKESRQSSSEELLEELLQETTDMGKSRVVEVRKMEELGRSLKVNEGRPALLFLSSKACRACKYLTPHFARFSDGNEDVLFLHVSTDESSEIPQTLGVNSVPTFIVFKDMQKMSEHHISRKEALERIIESLSLNV